jgi:hypothetical protein
MQMVFPVILVQVIPLLLQLKSALTDPACHSACSLSDMGLLFSVGGQIWQSEDLGQRAGGGEKLERDYRAAVVGELKQAGSGGKRYKVDARVRWVPGFTTYFLHFSEFY